MIKNERQYRITRARAERFEHDLARMIESPRGETMHPLLRNAFEEDLRDQLTHLRSEILEYETLQAGQYTTLETSSFAELPNAIIKARIAVGLSQRELADKLGIKEQQVQRYEATGYGAASLERVGEVINALGLQVREHIALPVDQMSLATLFRRLKEVGIEKTFVLKRLLPQHLADRIRTKKRGGESDAVAQVTAALQRIFPNLSLKTILGSEPLTMDSLTMGATRYKVAVNANPVKLNAYTIYAQYLALTVLGANQHLSTKPVPTSSAEVRSSIIGEYGALTFENILRYIWGLGIPVLPLTESGSFNGICWRSEGRNIIVLKQTTAFADRWSIAALHELRHAGEHPELSRFESIDNEETLRARNDSPSEETARNFALDVLLNDRALELAQLCVIQASSKAERMKDSVLQVANKQGVPTGVLADYMAYRLIADGVNWWGTATNLQETASPSPWQIAHKLFLEKFDFNQLNDVDRDLLLQALAEG